MLDCRNQWINSVFGARTWLLCISFSFYFINETTIYKISYTKAHPRQMQTIHATETYEEQKKNSIFLFECYDYIYVYTYICNSLVVSVNETAQQCGDNSKNESTNLILSHTHHSIVYIGFVGYIYKYENNQHLCTPPSQPHSLTRSLARSCYIGEQQKMCEQTSI